MGQYRLLLYMETGYCTEGTLSILCRASLCKPQCQYTHPFQCAKMHTVYKASNPLPLADD